MGYEAKAQRCANGLAEDSRPYRPSSATSQIQLKSGRLRAVCTWQGIPAVRKTTLRRCYKDGVAATVAPKIGVKVKRPPARSPSRSSLVRAGQRVESPRQQEPMPAANGADIFQNPPSVVTVNQRRVRARCKASERIAGVRDNFGCQFSHAVFLLYGNHQLRPRRIVTPSDAVPAVPFLPFQKSPSAHRNTPGASRSFVSNFAKIRSHLALSRQSRQNPHVQRLYGASRGTAASSRARGDG